jgi:hypothetical protein
VEARLANISPCLIGMEACVGAHHLGSPCARLSASCARNCPPSLRRAPMPCRHACCVQDRSPPARRNHLQRTAGPYIRVKAGRTRIEQMSYAVRPTTDIRQCYLAGALSL